MINVKIIYNGVRKIHDLKNSYKYNLPIVRIMATGTSLEGLFDSSTAVAITSNPTNAKKAGAASYIVIWHRPSH